MSLLSMLFSAKATHKNINVLQPDAFKTRILEHKNVQLVDVRTAKEFKSGHIKNAKNIDFYSGGFPAEFEKLNKTQPVYVYCRSGVRSRQAANKLVKMGFSEIYDLKGGYLSW
ncbi:rhodanese [Mangrovimonas yunxiaonensis]|uniref:Rhodanese n=1 Tax=Mangrovimonas yunxiaonensis TaxID=1197477 RepID=A0A084TJF6_9FLAO|nr:rhodanese-like domain-containing protein [Mangrovimonas yunxiaonensis]KFB00842.1 rhodanese [Mangrovimonas yunxiaonensis]